MWEITLKVNSKYKEEVETNNAQINLVKYNQYYSRQLRNAKCILIS
jgi:hypothetical protein